MKKQVLFVHGGGEGAHEEDRKLAENLQDALGPAYDVRCPKIPDEGSPEYEAWRDLLSEELAALDVEAILVGHSLGASGLSKYLSEVARDIENLKAMEGVRPKDDSTTAFDLQETDPPVGLGEPARRALLATGYRRLEQLGEVSEAEVKQLHSVGPKALERLRRALDDNGLSFAER